MELLSYDFMQRALLAEMLPGPHQHRNGHVHHHHHDDHHDHHDPRGARPAGWVAEPRIGG